jgi:hypothetical protein
MEDTMKVLTQNPYSNAGQGTVNGFSTNLSYKPTVEELNRTITGVAHENTPFSAVHPDVSGKRNPVRDTGEESITLGPAQEIRPRQHANGRPLLRAKKK